MQTSYFEIAPNIYRTTVAPSDKFAFNQFLIVDEHPLLIHTGRVPWFEDTRRVVSEIIDPKRLSYITFSHHEADETGALNQWIHESSSAKPIVGAIGKSSIEDFSNNPPVVLADGQSISLGKRSVTLIETPHFPHNWEAVMFYEPENKILFCSDMGAQPGLPSGFLADEKDFDKIMSFQKKAQYMVEGKPLVSAIEKLKNYDIELLAIHHGNAIKGKALVNAFFARLIKEFG